MWTARAIWVQILRPQGEVAESRPKAVAGKAEEKGGGRGRASFWVEEYECAESGGKRRFANCIKLRRACRDPKLTHLQLCAITTALRQVSGSLPPYQK
jgi:hypothetical protein